MTTKYYKFLEENGISPHRKHQWSLPKEGKPGDWMKHKGKVTLGSKGLHACTLAQCLMWAAPSMYEVEFKGDVEEGQDKVVGKEARLIRKIDNWSIKTIKLMALDQLEKKMLDGENAKILGGKKEVSSLIKTLRDRIIKNKSIKNFKSLKVLRGKLLKLSIPVSKVMDSVSSYSSIPELERWHKDLNNLYRWGNTITKLTSDDFNNIIGLFYAFGCGYHNTSYEKFAELCKKYGVE